MNPIPDDPMEAHGRFISALCTDWLNAGQVTRDTPLADAVLEIRRQTREDDDGTRP